MNKINTETNFESLAQQLWDSVHTQIKVPGIISLQKIANQIIEDNVEGDVIEVGVWEGGCIAFLSKLFKYTDKTIWAADSYDGFQKVEDGDYIYENERHTPEIHDFLKGTDYIRGAPSLQVSLERVQSNLMNYDVGEHGNVKFLKGYANETLNPEVCPPELEKISLLRVDVDAYSATKEVLDYLYDKVVPGGFIVFDDWGLPEAEVAIKHFFKERGLSINDLVFPYLETANNPYSGRYPYYRKEK